MLFRPVAAELDGGAWVYLGLRTEANTTRWLSGQPVGVFNAGQPDGDVNSCVIAVKSAGYLLWDVPCTYKYRSMCLI